MAMLRVGHGIVVATAGGAWMVPDAGASRQLEQGSIGIAGLGKAPDTAWLVRYGVSGGGLSAEVALWDLATGAVVRGPYALPSGADGVGAFDLTDVAIGNNFFVLAPPVSGCGADGAAAEDLNLLRLWNPDSGTLSKPYNPDCTSASVVDRHDSMLVWLLTARADLGEDNPVTVHVTDLRSGSGKVVATVCAPASSALSPDGAWVAVLCRTDGERMDLLNLATGHVSSIHLRGPEQSVLAWDPASRAVYAVIESDGSRLIRVRPVAGSDPVVTVAANPLPDFLAERQYGATQLAVLP